MLKYRFEIENKNNHGNIVDITTDRFDITWMNWPQYRNEKHFTLLPIENSEDDGTVTYDFNSTGFRCDDFALDHEKGKHILFGGCSQTEGVGGQLDTVWSKMIYNKLKENNLADGFYSLARAGYGWQKIISSFLIYSKKYGYPDYFFVLLPNVGRFFEWDFNLKTWIYIQRYPGNHQEGEKKENIAKLNDIDERPLTLEEHRRCLVDFFLGWRMLIELCNINNTKLLWSTWEYEQFYHYDMFDHSNTMITLSDEDLMKHIELKRPDGKTNKDDLFRRDGHYGVLQHDYWYNSFMKEINNRGWFND